MTMIPKPFFRVGRWPCDCPSAAIAVLLLLFSLGGLTAQQEVGRAEDSKNVGPEADNAAPDFREGSVATEEPVAVYAKARDDAWNRIFHDLFTRTVRVRLSNDFPEGGPFDRVQGRDLTVSRQVFERIESGDRAIDPFFPSHLVRYGRAPSERWVEPRFDSLKRALEDACNEKSDRSPLARALMQSDVWAAFDRLSAYGVQNREERERREVILSLLGRFARKLALTPEEIKALPDNYAAGVEAGKLPDLFAADGPWLEIEWISERVHDLFFDLRRVTRVFLKPAGEPEDKRAFVNGLRHGGKVARKLDSVALVIQSLLIDRTGNIVPAPLTYEVQVRRFLKNEEGKVCRAQIEQHEVSRRLLLADVKSGGLETIDRRAPIYLATAGNDLDFASDSNTGVEEPILVRLETRCTSCHGRNTESVFTFAFREMDDPPPVTILKPSENAHARFVAGRKAERKDFRALREFWKD